MKVKVISEILHEGKHQKIGTILDVPEALGKELISMGKCAYPGAAPAAEPEEEKKSKK